MSLVEAEHLGGYVPGGDYATWYPELWDWLVDDFDAHSFLDVGCGDGKMIDYLFDRGDCSVLGIEGTDQFQNVKIERWDYTRGPFPFESIWRTSGREWDVVWCCEFVEHVEEQFVPNFLDSFKRGKIVLMTHAEPGQMGYHHVNCQPRTYWIDKMRLIDYNLDIDLTMKTRELAVINENHWNHYVRSGLAFRRNND